MTPSATSDSTTEPLPAALGDRPAPGRAAASPAGLRRTVIRPRQGWQAINLRELWHARDLLWIFIVRDVKVRYKQTFFGFTWALVVPVVQVLVFSVLFGSVLGIGSRVNEAAGRLLPYPLFALSGQIVWNFFKMTLDGSSTCLITNAPIIRKVYIPRLVLPLAAVGKPAMDTVLVFGLMLALVAWYASDPASGVTLWRGLLFAPVLLAGAAIPALAIGLIVAAITVSYRDLQHILPFFSSTLFFVTPVIYSVDVLPDRFQWLIHLNPVAGFVQAHRAAVMDLPFDWVGLGIALAWSSVLLVAGLFYFARAERLFADVA